MKKLKFNVVETGLSEKELNAFSEKTINNKLLINVKGSGYCPEFGCDPYTPDLGCRTNHPGSFGRN